MDDLITFFIILIAGLIFSEIFKRLHLPYVTALILAGVVVGPFVLGIVQINSTIDFMAAIGLVFLMFIAGNEIDLHDIRKTFQYKILILVAFNGVIPMLVGFLITFAMGYSFITSLLIGIIFISSSIGIIIPSLESMGLKETKIGKSIITATVIEDLISLLLLSFVLQTITPSTEIPLFFYIPLLLILIYILNSIIPVLERSYHKGKTGKDLFESELRFLFVVLIATVILFGLLGMHAIMAGFVTGMILSNSIRGKMFEKIRILSYGLFIPIFFLMVGAQMDLSVLFSKAALTTILIIVVCLISSKVVSGWLGAKINNFSNKASLFIGISTLPQLSTSLAVAVSSLKLDLLDKNLFSAIVVLSIVTTLITPLCLKLVFKGSDSKHFK